MVKSGRHSRVFLTKCIVSLFKKVVYRLDFSIQFVFRSGEVLFDRVLCLVILSLLRCVKLTYGLIVSFATVHLFRATFNGLGIMQIDATCHLLRRRPVLHMLVNIKWTQQRVALYFRIAFFCPG